MYPSFHTYLTNTSQGTIAVNANGGSPIAAALLSFDTTLEDPLGCYDYADHPYYVTLPVACTRFKFLWRVDLNILASAQGDEGLHLFYEGTSTAQGDPGVSTDEAYFHVHNPASTAVGGGYQTIVCTSPLSIPAIPVYALPIVDTSGGSGAGTISITYAGKGTATATYDPDPATMRANLIAATGNTFGASTTYPLRNNVLASGDPSTNADTRLWTPATNSAWGNYKFSDTAPVVTVSGTGFTAGGIASGSTSLARVGLRLTFPVFNNTTKNQTVHRTPNLNAHMEWEMGPTIGALSAGQLTGQGVRLDANFNPFPGGKYYYRCVAASNGVIGSSAIQSGVADGSGNILIEMGQNASYQVSANGNNWSSIFATGDESTVTIPSVVG